MHAYLKCLFSQNFLLKLRNFLWGYVKDRVYKDGKPASLAELRQKIAEVISTVSTEMLENVFDNRLEDRLYTCIAQAGEHFAHVLK